MPAAVHFLLVVSTIIGAGVAWIIVGITPGTVVSIATTVVGGLLYIRPLGLDNAPARNGSVEGIDVNRKLSQIPETTNGSK